MKDSDLTEVEEVELENKIDFLNYRLHQSLQEIVVILMILLIWLIVLTCWVYVHN